jgi:hypothetical protein
MESDFAFEVVPSRAAFPGRRRVESSDIPITVDVVSSLTTGRPFRDEKSFIESNDILVVRGWAADLKAKSPVTGVFAVIDEFDYVMGVHGTPRDDVALVLGDVLPKARRSGFVVRIAASDLPAGSHRLAIVAVGADGASYGVLDWGDFAVISAPLS